MMDRHRFNYILSEVLAWLMIIAIAGFLVLFCTSCASKYITVPEYHYESHVLRDTIERTDTVTRDRETIIREADSMMLVGLGIRLKEGERAILVLRKELERVMSQQKEVRHDTVIKTDSVRVPYPVEKQLSKWQTIKMDIGGYCIFILLIVICYFISRRIRNP